jgi:hypothetical protein
MNKEEHKLDALMLELKGLAQKFDSLWEAEEKRADAEKQLGSGTHQDVGNIVGVLQQALRDHWHIITQDDVSEQVQKYVL